MRSRALGELRCTLYRGYVVIIFPHFQPATSKLSHLVTTTTYLSPESTKLRDSIIERHLEAQTRTLCNSEAQRVDGHHKHLRFRVEAWAPSAQIQKLQAEEDFVSLFRTFRFDFVSKNPTCDSLNPERCYQGP